MYMMTCTIDEVDIAIYINRPIYNCIKKIFHTQFESSKRSTFVMQMALISNTLQSLWSGYKS